MKSVLERLGGPSLQAPLTMGPYRIVHPLGQGGMGVVYRAEHVETGEPVALKTVSVTDASMLSSIRREIHALRRIEHPGVVRIVAEGFEGGLPWYAMELLEGDTLCDYIAGLIRAEPTAKRVYPPMAFMSAGDGEADGEADGGADGGADEPPDGWGEGACFTRAAGGDLPQTLTLMLGICDALACIHGMGLVHCDLKPDNVFLRTDGVPVLVDFGLAMQFTRGQGRDVLEMGELYVGTPYYMAPEQIRGEVIDARVDLYALGCMLYESVTGSVPFVGPARRVIEQHLYKLPEPPSARVPDVPPALDELILRLLQKRPQDRFGYAADVAGRLVRLGAEEHGVAPKTYAYLYRPGLAGRSQALAALADRLPQQGAQGEGPAKDRGGRVLVGGESGAGKTRFAMELASLAVQRGVRVVTGECAPVSAEAGERDVKAAPLHPFRNFLLALADHCRQHGPAEADRILGDRGPVLAAYEPSLARLPGQERYPEAPALDAPSARTRLQTCLAETLAAFAEVQPLLLVIDDLQWADETSLGVLEILDPTYFEATGLLVLATYRAEEGDQLRALLEAPGVVRVELGRLDAVAVKRMVSDMLAMPSPPTPFIEFLVEQSEGNPFFIAEYLRVAIDEHILHRDEAGEWQVRGREGEGRPPYDALPLPKELRELVGRRVAALGAGARRLGQVAAVLGREIDTEVLAGAAGLDDLGHLEAVEALRTRHILEVPEGRQGPERRGAAGARLRFVHDQLRRIIYNAIPEAERPGLHARAAAAIEARYAGTPELPAFYPSLAHHFAVAGDPGKALDYHEKAGEQALATGASADALGFFRKALELAEGWPAGGGEPLGPLRLAILEQRIGQAAFNLGRLAEAEEYTHAALRTLERRSPTGLRSGSASAPREPRPATARVLVWLLFHLVLQMIRLFWPRRYAADAAAGPTMEQGEQGERRRLTEAAHAAERLSEIYFFQDARLHSFATALAAANLAEGLGVSPELARSYATLNVIFAIAPLPGVAPAYAARAREVAEASADPLAIGRVSFFAGLTALVAGRWAEGRAALERALGTARSVRDPRATEESLAVLGNAELMIGRLEDALQRYDELHETARRSGNKQGQRWALLGRAQCMLALGLAEEAIALFERCRELAEPATERRGDPAEEITQGEVARAHLLLGDGARARAVAERTLAALVTRPPSGFHLLGGYLGTTEVLLALWERATSPEERVALGQSARRACRALRAYALFFPIARPHAHRFQGLCEALSGHPARAQRAFARSLAMAERLSMPIEQGLAHYEMGRHRVVGDPARATHLDAARGIFDRLGRTHWRERCAHLLAEGRADQKGAA